MMSDDIAQVCHEGEGVDVKVMHGYQSVWMAHWMHTSCKSATTPARYHLSIGCEPKEAVKEDSDAEQHVLHHGSEGAIDSSGHGGAVGEAARDTRVTLSHEADPGKSKKASFDSKSFPVFNHSQKTDGVLSPKKEQNDVCHGKDRKSETESSFGDDIVSLSGTWSHLPSKSAHTPPRSETLIRECQLLSQGASPASLLMKSPYAVEKNNLAVEKNNLAVSTSLRNDFVKSASGIVTNGRDKGKTLMLPVTRGQHEIYQSSYKLASQENFTSTKYHSYSSLLIREKKMSSLLDPQRSSISRWIQGDVTHLPHDPIAGGGDESYLIHGQHHKIQNYTANANIPNHTASLKSTKPQCFYGGSSLVAQLPCSVHDMETMKIYTSIDSVEESSRDHPKISQTSHYFPMLKKVDVNLFDRGQSFRESTTPTKFKGNAFNEILDFSLPMSDHALEGRKLEDFTLSKKSEGKENVQDLKSPTSLKNESSAETDAMDINALHKNNLTGNVPLQTNKCSKDSQNSLTSLVAAMTSAGEKNKAKSVNTTLPDINQEPPEQLLTLASPVVDRETSTSRTHSLDMEHLLPHADEHGRSKSGNSSLGPDPSSRWVKRLKLCTSSSVHGTKSAAIGETTSHEKVNNVFSKMKGSKNNSEPKMVYHVEEQMVPDLPTTILTNGKCSFTEAKKTVDITLSHPWIQRWSHDHAVSSQKVHELVELCEPKSSDTLDEFQKKQFPSIAAMALMMGKAMSCLNPSELMKKGPVIVWNTKGY